MRPRKATRGELEAELARQRSDATVLSEALGAILHGPDVDAETRVEWEGDEGWYVLRLVHSTRAHGGLVLVTFYCRGQRPHTTAHYLEEHVRQSAGAALEYRVGLERLYRERDRRANYHAATGTAHPSDVPAEYCPDCHQAYRAPRPRCPICCAYRRASARERRGARDTGARGAAPLDFSELDSRA